jgi:hypothetical protein
LVSGADFGVSRRRDAAEGYEKYADTRENPARCSDHRAVADGRQARINLYDRTGAPVHDDVA